jgi:hypothetical protein
MEELLEAEILPLFFNNEKPMEVLVVPLIMEFIQVETFNLLNVSIVPPLRP